MATVTLGGTILVSLFMCIDSSRMFFLKKLVAIKGTTDSSGLLLVEGTFAPGRSYGVLVEKSGHVSLNASFLPDPNPDPTTVSVTLEVRVPAWLRIA